MNIVSWTPFQDMDDVFSRFHRLYGGLSPKRDGDLAAESAWWPVADISESEDEYLIKAQLPEVDRKDVKVTVDGGMVSIRGERRMEKDEKDAKQHRIESFYGTFSRSFALPDDADVQHIKAKSKDGVLRISIPKTKQAASKKIDVAVD